MTINRCSSENNEKWPTNLFHLNTSNIITISEIVLFFRGCSTRAPTHNILFFIMREVYFQSPDLFYSNFTSLFISNLSHYFTPIIIVITLTSSLFLHKESAAEISCFITTKLGSITGTLTADVRSDFEPEDEGFSDINNVEKVLSAILTALHTLLKSQKTSVVDNSII